MFQIAKRAEDNSQAPRSALHAMRRGVPDRENAQNAIPSATFESPDKLKAELRYRPAGYQSQLVLGEVDGVMIGTKPGEDRHLLTVAGSRSGKSVSAIVPNLLEYGGSVLVMDPKAELASETALHRKNELGQTVYVIDPFRKSSQSVQQAGLLASFNPLTILQPDSDTLVEDADLIGDAMVIQAGRDPHWDESAKRVLQGIMLHVATFARYEGRRDLCTVRDLINNGATVDRDGLTAAQEAALAVIAPDGDVPAGIDGLLHEMMLNDSAAGMVVYAAANDLYAKPDKEKDSVLSTLRRHTAFLDFPRLRGVLADNSFPDLGVLKSDPHGVTVYLCLPAGYMRICNRWLRLFVYLALQAMERTKVSPTLPTGERRARVLFCLDEFPVLGYMPQLEEAAGQLGGFGVRLWPIVQDLTQLKALYKDRWETFVGNAAVIQLFGISDLTTLEYVSKLAGKVAVAVEGGRLVSFAEGTGGAQGTSWSIQTFDLLPVHEARTAFDRDDAHARQLLLYQGYDPIIASRVKRYEHPYFKDKGDYAGVA